MIVCCIIRCLPLLVVRRTKRKEIEETELFEDNVEWDLPVHEYCFPPLSVAQGDCSCEDYDVNGKNYKIGARKETIDEEIDFGASNEGEGGLVPHATLFPYEGESNIEYSHRFLDNDCLATTKKSRLYPGRTLDEADGRDSCGINIYPRGAIEVDYEDDDNLRLHGVAK